MVELVISPLVFSNTFFKYWLVIKDFISMFPSFFAINKQSHWTKILAGINKLDNMGSLFLNNISSTKHFISSICNNKSSIFSVSICNKYDNSRALISLL